MQLASVSKLLTCSAASSSAVTETELPPASHRAAKQNNERFMCTDLDGESTPRRPPAEVGAILGRYERGRRGTVTGLAAST